MTRRAGGPGFGVRGPSWATYFSVLFLCLCRASSLINVYYYTKFITSADTNLELPEDGVVTPKHVATILSLILIL